jgi:WhiB family redox-sensing transcriptional regulator
MWFPVDERLFHAARAVCARCPVLEMCLQHALDVPALEGVWGGTTTDQRRRMRTARNRTEWSTDAAG